MVTLNKKPKPAAQAAPTGDQEPIAPNKEFIERIANLTARLRESMTALGLDQAVHEAAQAIPDARDRLGYVARMTEQAANRVLNEVERMQPKQASVEQESKELARALSAALEKTSDRDPNRPLIEQALRHVKSSGDVAEKTQQALLEIMMAQDFQDLTGQVITRMLDVINMIEKELIAFLAEQIPTENKGKKLKESLINGPQVNPKGKMDVVVEQKQVDDLLASLGL